MPPPRRTSDQNALVLFPGALGDFLCFLPTLVAVHARHRGALRVVAKPSLLELISPLRVAGISIDRREVADLFSTAAEVRPETAALFAGVERVYSWTGSTDPDLRRRLRAIADAPVDIHPFRGMRPGEHAADYYARCAGVEPHDTIGACIADDPQWFASVATDYPEGTFMVVHPGSGAARKNWQGFASLMRWCQQRGDVAILLRGPAETALGSEVPAAGVLDGLTLIQVASLLRRTRLYVGNDSGITHLAAAVGTATVALFGPTDPAVWAPRGKHVQILRAPEACRRCGDLSFCLHRLPAERVIAVLQRLSIDAVARPAEVGGGMPPR